jgi:hypothetical protein
VRVLDLASALEQVEEQEKVSVPSWAIALE